MSLRNQKKQRDRNGIGKKTENTNTSFIPAAFKCQFCERKNSTVCRSSDKHKLLVHQTQQLSEMIGDEYRVMIGNRDWMTEK